MGFNPVEFVKDMVGIIDDAGDVSDDLEKVLKRVHKQVSDLSTQSDQFHAAVGNADLTKAGDLKRVIQSTGSKAPILWRKARGIAGQLKQVRSRITKVTTIVKGTAFPEGERPEALSHIREITKRVDDMERSNVKVIKVYDNVVKGYNKHQTTWRKILTALNVGNIIITAGLSATAFAVISSAGPLGVPAAAGLMMTGTHINIATAILNTLAGIIKGAQEGRIILNVLNNWFIQIIAVVRSLGFIIKKIAQAIAAGSRATHAGAVSILKKMAPGQVRNIAPEPA